MAAARNAGRAATFPGAGSLLWPAASQISPRPYVGSPRRLKPDLSHTLVARRARCQGWRFGRIDPVAGPAECEADPAA